MANFINSFDIFNYNNYQKTGSIKSCDNFINENKNQLGMKFKKGDEVVHKLYGKGVVEEISGNLISIKFKELYGSKILKFLTTNKDVMNDITIIENKENYNEDDDNLYWDWEVGDLVLHKKFGVGKIIGIHQGTLSDSINVKFGWEIPKELLNKTNQSYSIVTVKSNELEFIDLSKDKLTDKEINKAVNKPLADIVNDKIKKKLAENDIKKNKEEIIEEIEEEEEEEEYVDVDELEDITEEDLMITEIKEFFSENELKKIVTLDDVLNYRKELTQKTYNYHNLNPLQKKVLGRRIAITYIIERYFKYMQQEFPYAKIYRYIGQMPYEELYQIRKKEVVPFYKEMYDIHGYDYGVIYYWIFSDGIIFKTI